VREGYGALVVSHAAGVQVSLQTPVRAIDSSGKGLAIETSRGTIRAAKAIVTASTTVLAAGAIRFAPAFDTVLHAAANLPLGIADKLFLAVDGAEAFDDNAHLTGNPRDPATGAYTLRPFGQPVIEVLLGGAGAEAAEAAGLDGAAAHAIDELCALIGNDWRKRLRLLAGSAWRRDPNVGGGYSHALPGRRDARLTLAMPVDPRVRFAGEACSPGEFSTVHGAYKTGVAAAKALLA
jgi:monoamine oxidase